MAQDRLLTGAPEALHVAATYVVGRGWFVHLGVRRQFEPWAEATRATYEQLTTDELVQVLEDELGQKLLGPVGL
jgi:hypothetical protein